MNLLSIARRVANELEFPEAVTDRIKESGIDPKSLKYLGSGIHGTAYKSGDLVLKVTDDVKEAKTANHLIGKDTKHIVKIYDVFRHGDVKGIKYYIIQEYLDPMDGTDAREFDMAMGNYGVRIGPFIIPGVKGNWSAYERKVLDNASKQATFDSMDLDENEASQIIEAYVQKAKESLDTLKNKFKLDEIIKEIHELGVSYTDYKSDNMRKRGNDYVMIDMSEANSPGNDPKMV